jgi:hypothetical protein
MRPFSILAIFSVGLASAADVGKEGVRWWSHIQVLADDAMQGRETGSPGHQKAAQFVAGEFERAGLKAAGTSGYLQPVKLDERRLVEEASSLALVRKGNITVPLTLGDDATIGFRGDLAENVDAPAVFVGYGLVIPENHVDDLAGLDLKGKIAVYLAGGPSSVPSALRAHYSSRGERWRALQNAGAIGMAAIANPKSMDIPWARSTLARLNPAMTLADEKLLEVRGMQFNIQINPEHAQAIFSDSGHSFGEVLALADADKPLPKFPLNVNFRAQVRLKRSRVESPNVVGLLPGSDPRLKDEYVVFSAHLDHLGVGQPIKGDAIYNGAMDDGSGIATLIEIATLLREEKIKLKRGVIFLAVTGEEKGELGSLYYASHPTVPKKKIIADINIDMFLPLFPLKYLEVQGLDESTLGEEIRAACKNAGVMVQADKEPDRNLFIRSDQYSFVKEGIPALAFKFGYEKGSHQEKIAKDWLRERYHAPSDDLNQPVDKTAAAQFDRVLLDLGERVANAQDRPHWNDHSFFRRFAAD